MLRWQQIDLCPIVLMVEDEKGVVCWWRESREWKDYYGKLLVFGLGLK